MGRMLGRIVGVEVDVNGLHRFLGRHFGDSDGKRVFATERGTKMRVFPGGSDGTRILGYFEALRPATEEEEALSHDVLRDVMSGEFRNSVSVIPDGFVTFVGRLGIPQVFYASA